jgi:biotin carboxylase
MKKIAIIGGSYLQLPLVKKAIEMNIETHCFSWEEGAVCKEIADYFYPISIIEKEIILETCIAIKIDGVVSIASDAAVRTVCYVAEKMGLISNKFEESFVSTNKYLMRKRFTEYNIRSPRYIIANENYSIKDLKFPLIVKPTDRSGSLGVKKIEEESKLKVAVESAKMESFSNNAIIEEYISGKEVSVESISWKGKHYILAITDKITTNEPYFVELEHHQPSQLDIQIQEKIKSETLKALSALRIIYGASHSEFKITDDGKIYIIEVGARMGGDFIGSNLVELSTGYDFLKGVIEVSLGVFNLPFVSNTNYAGVYFLCKNTVYLQSIFNNGSIFDSIIKMEITNPELKKVECSADRSGYFIYKSKYKPNVIEEKIIFA